MSIEGRLREFITDELHFDGSLDALTDDFPLIERKVVDSMGIYQIVTFVETEYGVEVNDEELVPEHFATIATIARLVSSKLA